MRFKVDENLPVEAADLLRLEGRAILTLDLDFSDIRAYPPRHYAGIIILRPNRQDIASLMALVRRFLPLLSVEPLAGTIWIVEPDRIRIRQGSL